MTDQWTRNPLVKLATTASMCRDVSRMRTSSAEFVQVVVNYKRLLFMENLGTCKSEPIADDRSMAKVQKAVRIRGKRAPAFGRDIVVVRTG